MIWQVRTSKIVRSYKLPNKVSDLVAWCPREDTCMLAVCNEHMVHLVLPNLYSKAVNEATQSIVDNAAESYKVDVAASRDKEKVVKWTFNEKMVTIEFNEVISKLAWHSKGDFFSTMAHNVQATT